MTTKEEKEREKRRLTLGIPRGAPKAVKVFSLTKEGREFLERLWEAFPELRPRPTSIEEPIPMTTDETVAHYIHEAVKAESEPPTDEEVYESFIEKQMPLATTEQSLEAESKASFDKVNQLFVDAQKRKEAAEMLIEAGPEPSQFIESVFQRAALKAAKEAKTELFEKEIVEAQKKAEVQDMIHAQELAKAAEEARKAESEVIDVGIVGTSLTTKKAKREALKAQLTELGEEE